jgi:hypothetical protein
MEGTKMWNETRLGKYLLERWYEKVETVTIVKVPKVVTQTYVKPDGSMGVRKITMQVPTRVVAVTYKKRTRYIGKVKP